MPRSTSTLPADNVFATTSLCPPSGTKRCKVGSVGAASQGQNSPLAGDGENWFSLSIWLREEHRELPAAISKESALDLLDTLEHETLLMTFIFINQNQRAQTR